MTLLTYFPALSDPDELSLIWTIHQSYFEFGWYPRF